MTQQAKNRLKWTVIVSFILFWPLYLVGSILFEQGRLWYWDMFYSDCGPAIVYRKERTTLIPHVQFGSYDYSTPHEIEARYKYYIKTNIGLFQLKEDWYESVLGGDVYICWSFRYDHYEIMELKQHGLK